MLVKPTGAVRVAGNSFTRPGAMHDIIAILLLGYILAGSFALLRFDCGWNLDWLDNLLMGEDDG